MSRIHPTAIVSQTAELAEGVEVGPYCIIEGDVRIGPNTRLMPHVCILDHTKIGADCVVFPNAVLGAWPQDKGFKGERTCLEIGDRNIIRENVTMHRGTTKDRGLTSIGDDGYFMAGTHIAHDCIVGSRVTMVNGANVGGHSTIGDRVNISAYAALHQFTHIGEGAFVAGLAKVVTDVIPYGMADGNPCLLRGLNLVGLKRSGFDRASIHAIRHAYRLLFEADDAQMQWIGRVEALAAMPNQTREVVQILDFIQSPRRGRELMRA
jgi:UDP-N-acetylglucosamine acyltransferase